MNSAPLRVLYIDDEPGIREMTRRELSRQGIDITVASSGDEGLELFLRSPFPVVVSDLKMPGMNGLQVLQAIKANDPDTEVLIATGFGSQDDAIACLKAGAHDYIYKPFNMTEFLVLIRRAWEHRSLKAHVALSECLQAINESLDLDVVLKTVTESLCKTLHAEEASVEFLEGPKAAAADRSGSPALLEVEDTFHGEKRCSLKAPLHAREGELRYLVARRKGPCPSFSESDKRTLFLFASHAAGAIENAQLHQALQKRVEELQETRELLIQSEKMSALGRLAAGVAHEINNPLTGILGQAQMLLLNTPLNAPFREDLVFLESAAQRCRAVVQSLLQFSRRQKIDCQPVDLMEIVRQALLLIRKSLTTQNIHIEESSEKDLPPVLASPVHLSQVFLNLFQNAIDAMGTEGTLRIRAIQGEAEVRLFVTDTGPGIAADVLPHIFEPFFTTKGIGKGTGLGLAVSKGILRDLKGSIEVHSPPPGQASGAEFILSLPIAAIPATEIITSSETGTHAVR